LDAINIAPELGRIETMVVLAFLYGDSINSFFDLCLKSNCWKKWVAENFNPYENKKSLIEICGHYVFSTKEFQDIISKDKEEIRKETLYRVHSFIDNIL
jgi:hypothetical protein